MDDAKGHKRQPSRRCVAAVALASAIACLNPQVIMPGRLAKFAFQIDF